MEPLRCYRCGASLAALTLPLGRLEECPGCAAQLHVCRMCQRYAPQLPKGCNEDDAPDVRNKKSANFCDYFKPSPQAFTTSELAADEQARTELDALFGAGSAQSPADAGTAPEARGADPWRDAHNPALAGYPCYDAYAYDLPHVEPAGGTVLGQAPVTSFGAAFMGMGGMGGNSMGMGGGMGMGMNGGMGMGGMMSGGMMQGGTMGYPQQQIPGVPQPGVSLPLLPSQPQMLPPRSPGLGY